MKDILSHFSPDYHICLAVILVDFVFKKDEIYYPHYSVLKRMYIQWKSISDYSVKEQHFFNKSVKRILKREKFTVCKRQKLYLNSL